MSGGHLMKRKNREGGASGGSNQTDDSCLPVSSDATEVLIVPEALGVYSTWPC